MKNSFIVVSAALLFGCAGLSIIEDEKSRQRLQASLDFFEKQEFDSSISHAKSIGKGSKSYGVALLIEAFVHSKMGKWDSTQAKLKACTKYSKPGSIEYEIGSLFLGYLSYDRKPDPDLVSAASHFIKIGKSSPLYDEALIGLGWSFLKVQRSGDAKKYFEKVIQMDRPSLFKNEAYYGAGASNFFVHEYEKSIIQCDEALRPNKTNQRFGITVTADSLYNRKDIMREALQVRWSVACVMDKERDSKSCIRSRELNRATEPVELLQWQNGKLRIEENIALFSKSILRERISK